ncbi:proteasomal ATPase-associated factor 1 isoform 2-T2 [Hipposideros larvatus]
MLELRIQEQPGHIKFLPYSLQSRREHLRPCNQQARSRSARYVSPCKDEARSAHRTGGQEDPNARSSTSTLEAVGTLPILLPGTSLCEEHARGRGRERKGPTAHFHWWSLFVDPALRPTSGKERKRRVGGGGVKMAAPLRIQSDWAQALRKDEGEAWLSCHPPGKPTLYGSLTCQGIGLDGIPEVTASEGFIVNEINKALILSLSSDIIANFCCVAAGSDKKHSYFMSKGKCIFKVFGTIYYFFQNSCKQCILDTAIVDRGRNVVSGSRDGTARLWDCGRSACLGVIADCGASINGVAVGAADNSINLGSPEQMPSEREVGTESKMLLLAREDKKLQCLGLQSRQPVFLFIGSEAFNCCTFLSGFLLLAGTQDGNIYQLDVRNPRAPVQVIHRSGAPVLSLLSFRDGFIASQGDGSCFIVQQDLDYVIELTGADCDPVYKVATWEKQIYTCCRDGLVRRYQLADL